MDNFKEKLLNTSKCLTEVEDFLTKKVGENPDTQSTTWVVEYKPNLVNLYKDIDDVTKKIERLQKRVQTHESEVLLKFAKSLRNRFARLLKKYNDISEQSSTGQGGATFTPGEGAQYATPNAFAKKKKEKGVKNTYYYKLGYKNIPKTKPKSFEKKQLWEKEKLNELNNFQEQRLKSLDNIEELMKDISPLISNEKNKTIELYSADVGSYDINSPIEIVKSYLQDIKKLLTEE